MRDVLEELTGPLGYSLNLLQEVKVYCREQKEMLKDDKDATEAIIRLNYIENILLKNIKYSQSPK